MLPLQRRYHQILVQQRTPHENQKSKNGTLPHLQLLTRPPTKNLSCQVGLSPIIKSVPPPALRQVSRNLGQPKTPGYCRAVQHSRRSRKGQSKGRRQIGIHLQSQPNLRLPRFLRTFRLLQASGRGKHRRCWPDYRGVGRYCYKLVWRVPPREKNWSKRVLLCQRYSALHLRAAESLPPSALFRHRRSPRRRGRVSILQHQQGHDC